MLSTDKKPSAVQSIFRAANVLACIGQQVHSMTDIADRCKLSNSTVHRLLKALEESHLVIQDPVTHKYYLGELITHLVADIQIPHEYLIACTKEEINRIAEITQETVSLAVMIGQQYNALYEVPSKHNLRVVVAGINTIEPMRAEGAAGKILLAQLNDKELRIRLKNIQLGVADNNIIDIEETISQINCIKQQGYALSQDEVVIGGTCVSAPINNYIVPVAISIFGPNERVKPRIEEYINILCASGKLISHRLAQTLRVK